MMAKSDAENALNEMETNLEEIFNSILKRIDDESIGFESPIIDRAIKWLLGFKDPSGGFTNEGENIPSPASSAYVLLALSSSGYKYKNEIASIINYLKSTQNSDGSWSYYAGSEGSIGVTSLVLKALNRAGFAGIDIYLKGEKYLIESVRKLLNSEQTELNISRLSLALIAVGKHFKSIKNDILKWFENGMNPNFSFGLPPEGDAEVTSTVYAALKNVGIDNHMTMGMLSYIFGMQSKIGLFRPNNKTEERVDTTAYIILQLIWSGYDIISDERIIKALSSMIQFMNDDGGFPDYAGDISDVETTALVITVLSLSGFAKVIKIPILRKMITNSKKNAMELYKSAENVIINELTSYRNKISTLEEKVKFWKAVAGALGSILIAVISILVEIMF